MSNEFNKSNWREFEVKKPEQAPQGQHYAAVLFGSYYKDDGYGGSYFEPDTTYYAFKKLSELQMFVKQAQASANKFFFFEVKKLGSFEVKVNLDLED